MHPTAPRVLQLRECGLAVPRKSLHPILNIRTIAFKREIKDRFLKFDERVQPRNEAYMRWVEKVDAVQDKEPLHVIEDLDTAYKQAMQRIEEAATIRNKRVQCLLKSVELIRRELKK